MIADVIRRFALYALLVPALGACGGAPAPLDRRSAAAPIEYRGAPPAPTTAPTSAPAQAPVARASAAAAPSPAPAAAGEIVVPAGATLYQIAEENRVSLRELVDANRLAPPFQLAAGQRLRLPPPNGYVVVRGDTLTSVARRHSIQPRSLALLNGLEEPYDLRVGQTLVLPGSVRDLEASAAPAVAGTSPPPVRVAAPTGPAPRFDWPLAGTVIDGFGPKDAGRRNDGVNIAAEAGATVRAAADGLVVYAGDELDGYGVLVLIQHAGGWMSAYAHNRRLLVAEEQRVSQGDPIAEAGSTGGVDSPQLHFELRRDGGAVDPLSELPPRPR